MFASEYSRIKYELLEGRNKYLEQEFVDVKGICEQNTCLR